MSAILSETSASRRSPICRHAWRVLDAAVGVMPDPSGAGRSRRTDQTTSGFEMGRVVSLGRSAGVRRDPVTIRNHGPARFENLSMTWFALSTITAEEYSPP